MRTALRILATLGAFALLLALTTCSKPTPAAQPQKVAVAASLPVESVQPEVIVATFVSGDVQAGKLTSWEAITTGAMLAKDQSVKTAAQSECELQLGKTAVVRIEEKTIVELKTFSTVGGKTRIAMGLDQGSVLCKVRKLTGGESFRVQTETAIGGVRGTEFQVSVSTDKTTVVAVKEGSVAVLPASADVTAAEQAADQGVSVVDDLLDKVQTAAPVVAGGQQISYTPQAAQESAAALSGMGDVVQKMVEASRSNLQVSAQVLQQGDQIAAKAAAALPPAAGAPSAITPQNVQLMKPLDTMEIRENPQAPAAPAQNSQAPPPAPAPPRPIESRIAASRRALVGAVLSSGQDLVAADASGMLVAAGRGGKVIWTIRTANSPNENSIPVVAGGNVYFSGAKEFVIARLATGAVVSRTALDSTSAHIFGQHVLVAPPLGLYPTATSVRVFDPATGQVARDIQLPGGSMMSPALADGKVLAVNQAGVFLVVDAASGNVDAQIPTHATQPVALSVSLKGQSAFFADRKGLVVAVDLAGRQILWSTPLPGTGSGGVFQDLEVTETGVYAFARGTLFAFSVADGKLLFDPVPGVTTPPLVSNGRLYIGSAEKKLLVLDPATGKAITSLDVGAKPTTRPSADGSRIIVGTDEGQILVINPDALK